MTTTKVMVSLPERLLAEIDRAAREAHASRSGFLREAAQAYIAQRTARRAPGDDPAVRAADEAIRALAARTALVGDQSSLEVLRRLRSRHTPAEPPESEA
jgi:hypothetical protein